MHLMKILYGLAHIHSRYVLHRDIKLDNLLLGSDWEVKICDFGVSKIITDSYCIKEQCGTPAYLAPEIIDERGYHGYTSDLWSLGIVLYSMMFASVPYKAKNLEELKVVFRTASVHYPSDIGYGNRIIRIKRNHQRFIAN